MNSILRRIEVLERKKAKSEMFWQNHYESIVEVERRYNKPIKETDLIICWRN